MKTVNIIMVKHGVQDAIAKVMNCTPQYVSLALNGHRTNGKAIKIRHIALTQYKGVEMQPVNTGN